MKERLPILWLKKTKLQDNILVAVPGGSRTRHQAGYVWEYVNNRRPQTSNTWVCCMGTDNYKNMYETAHIMMHLLCHVMLSLVNPNGLLLSLSNFISPTTYFEIDVDYISLNNSMTLVCESFQPCIMIGFYIVPYAYIPYVCIADIYIMNNFMYKTIRSLDDFLQTFGFLRLLCFYVWFAPEYIYHMLHLFFLRPK